MKNTLTAVLFSALSWSGFSQASVDPEKITERIREPEFQTLEYDIRDFGAVASDSIDSRDAINAAIDKCCREGGGRVNVPQGRFFVKGPILLKSYVNLHLQEKSELSFSASPEDYLPPVLTNWEGTQLYNYSPLIYAFHANNVALTGKGVINGHASQGFARMVTQGSFMQNALRQMANDSLPVKDRCFGKFSYLPPSMVQFYGCSDILVEDIHLKDSPYWVIHPVFCNNVTVRGAEITSYNRNNDGCDPECSRNVLIENCTFNVGDDAVAIKAGRDNDGWRIGQPSENIVIRNCVFNSRCNGLCIGSEMSAGVRNIYMENVRISNSLSGIYFKSNLDRGGYIRNVVVRNVECDSVKSAFVRFETQYQQWRGGFYPAVFEKFLIENVKGNVSQECGIFAVGIDKYPIRDITLRNVEIRKAPQPYMLKYAENICFDGVVVNGKKLEKNPQPTSAAVLQSW